MFPLLIYTSFRNPYHLYPSTTAMIELKWSTFTSVSLSCYRQCVYIPKQGVPKTDWYLSCEVPSISSCLQWTCREGRSNIKGVDDTAEGRNSDNKTFMTTVTLLHEITQFNGNFTIGNDVGKETAIGTGFSVT